MNKAKLEKSLAEFKILIAEDQLENRLLHQELLVPAGFQVLEALNGKEAIEVCQEYLPVEIKSKINFEILPSVIRARLLKSAELPDITGCMEILYEIKQEYPETVQYIQKLLENYEFDQLISYIESIIEEEVENE